MKKSIFIMLFLIAVSSCSDSKEKKQQKMAELAKAKNQELMKKIQDSIKKTDPRVLYSDYEANESVNINLGPIKSRVYGNKNAKNSLVVFSDFACGHCAKASKSLRDRVDENKEDINLYYVLYPLSKDCNPKLKGKLSDYSCPSAFLALCAEKEGKFWQAVDYLYGKKSEAKDIKIFTKQMSKDLNIKDLELCVDSAWVKNKMKSENQVYKELKIKGTPTVFLNKKQLKSAYRNKDVFAKFLNYFISKEDPNRK